MKVIIVNADSEKLEVTEEFENSLESLQKVVGGYIEVVTLRGYHDEDRRITMWLNEEGKLSNLPPNIAMVRRSNQQLADVIVGNAIITSTDSEGETVGLNDEEIEFIKGVLHFNKGVMVDGKVFKKVLDI